MSVKHATHLTNELNKNSTGPGSLGGYTHVSGEGKTSRPIFFDLPQKGRETCTLGRGFCKLLSQGKLRLVDASRAACKWTLVVRMRDVGGRYSPVIYSVRYCYCFAEPWLATTHISYLCCAPRRVNACPFFKLATDVQQAQGKTRHHRPCNDARSVSDGASLSVRIAAMRARPATAHSQPCSATARQARQ